MADWLLYRPARSALILVAPHGGRRRRKIRRGDGVNDLYTAELTEQLAGRLNAVALVNRGLDRNHIDLNRIGDLVEKAPQFIELLCDTIDNAPGGRATVLFVHGWNMVVPCCDIGVGLRRRGDQLYGRYPTVSRRFFDTAVAVLAKEFSRHGLCATVGLRYPGNGRNNALQLFSGRHVSHEQATVRRLAEAALAGRVDAVQLELGIPLRWPGPLREAMLDSLVVAARAIESIPANDGRDWNLPSAEQPALSTEVPESGFVLQSVIGDGRVGLFAGVEATAPSSMAARLCLVAGEGRMFLFVGEGEWNGRAGRYQDRGLYWRARADRSWAVSYSGAMVAYQTHCAYEDLETGLARAVLVEAEIELEARVVEGLADPFRELRYRVVVDGVSYHGVSVAVCERGSRRDEAPVAERARVCLLAGPDARQVTRSVVFDEPDGVSLSIKTRAGEQRRGRIIARVPVWRVLADRRVTRFTFGMASFAGQASGATATAIYDRLEIFEGDREDLT